mmetsp:Transcript_16389/g.41099  ORF Transcript_16389/g.41099 Transcript_16389/m.41099 type:complete len:307 (-) Transcript_16389:2-922(-)
MERGHVSNSGFLNGVHFNGRGVFDAICRRCTSGLLPGGLQSNAGRIHLFLSARVANDIGFIHSEFMGARKFQPQNTLHRLAVLLARWDGDRQKHRERIWGKAIPSLVAILIDRVLLCQVLHVHQYWCIDWWYHCSINGSNRRHPRLYVPCRDVAGRNCSICFGDISICPASSKGRYVQGDEHHLVQEWQEPQSIFVESDRSGFGSFGSGDNLQNQCIDHSIQYCVFANGDDFYHPRDGYETGFWLDRCGIDEQCRRYIGFVFRTCCWISFVSVPEPKGYQANDHQQIRAWIIAGCNRNRVGSVPRA